MSSGKWRPFCLGLNVLIWCDNFRKFASSTSEGPCMFIIVLGNYHVSLSFYIALTPPESPDTSNSLKLDFSSLGECTGHWWAPTGLQWPPESQCCGALIFPFNDCRRNLLVRLWFDTFRCLPNVSVFIMWFQILHVTDVVAFSFLVMMLCYTATLTTSSLSQCSLHHEILIV